MATKAIALVTNITKNFEDQSKIDVAMHIIGTADVSHEFTITRSAIDPSLLQGPWDQYLHDELRQWFIDSYSYTFGANDDVKVVNMAPAPVVSYPTRTLNSAFQISTLRGTFVNYSVDIACALSLTGGQTGTVFLEIANDSGFTSGVQELTRAVNGNTGTLTIGLNITQNSTGQVSGYVPPAKYVRIRTANTTGTPTFNYRSGQEVIF